MSQLRANAQAHQSHHEYRSVLDPVEPQKIGTLVGGIMQESLHAQARAGMNPNDTVAPMRLDQLERARVALGAIGAARSDPSAEAMLDHQIHRNTAHLYGQGWDQILSQTGALRDHFRSANAAVGLEEHGNVMGELAAQAIRQEQWEIFGHLAQGVASLSATEQLRPDYQQTARNMGAAQRHRHGVQPHADAAALGGASRLASTALPAITQAFVEKSQQTVELFSDLQRLALQRPDLLPPDFDPQQTAHAFAQTVAHAQHEGTEVAEYYRTVLGQPGRFTQAHQEQLLHVLTDVAEKRAGLSEWMQGIPQPLLQAAMMQEGLPLPESFNRLKRIAEEAKVGTIKIGQAETIAAKGDFAAAITLLGDLKKGLQDMVPIQREAYARLDYQLERTACAILATAKPPEASRPTVPPPTAQRLSPDLF